MSGFLRNLPPEIFPKNDVARQRIRLEKMMSAASSAVFDLHLMLDGFGIKNNVSEWQKLSDVDWVCSVIDEKINALEKLAESDVALLVSKGELNYKKKTMMNGKETARKNAAIIRELLTAYPDAKFSINQTNETLTCSNIDEVLKRKSKVEVSNECKELFRQYANCVDDVRRLNKFAKDNGFRQFKVGEIGQYPNAQSFADSWALGLMSIHPTDEQLTRRIEPQEAKKPRFV